MKGTTVMSEKENKQLSDNELDDVSGGKLTTLGPKTKLATVWKKCKYCPKQYQTTATDLSYICPDCKKKFSGKVL